MYEDTDLDLGVISGSGQERVKAQFCHGVSM